jgi:hypothetical protein
MHRQGAVPRGGSIAKAYVVGRCNVFADLGHPRPAEALAKAELARKTGALIAKRGLSTAFRNYGDVFS